MIYLINGVLLFALVQLNTFLLLNIGLNSEESGHQINAMLRVASFYKLAISESFGIFNLTDISRNIDSEINEYITYTVLLIGFHPCLLRKT